MCLIYSDGTSDRRVLSGLNGRSQATRGGAARRKQCIATVGIAPTAEAAPVTGGRPLWAACMRGASKDRQETPIRLPVVGSGLGGCSVDRCTREAWKPGRSQLRWAHESWVLQESQLLWRIASGTEAEAGFSPRFRFDSWSPMGRKPRAVEARAQEPMTGCLAFSLVR